jgi:hypothetical protein
VNPSAPAHSFCETHAIREDVWEARGYQRYERDDPDGLVRDAWATHKRFAKKIADQCGGVILARYQPEGIDGLFSVPAELRPDGVPVEELPRREDGTPILAYKGMVCSGWHYHYHGDHLREDGWPRTPKRENLPPEFVHSDEHGPKAHILQHIRDIHGGINDQTVHRNEKWGKYIMMPLDDERPWESSMRLDVHPFSQGTFLNAPRAFMSLEGIPKNDALVSALLDADELPAVFNVLSVTHWRAPEFAKFAIANLLGKPVYLICDADWSRNWMVVRQAFLCREFLRRLGVDAHVGGPPLADFLADAKLKGIDDSLASGRTLDDIEIIDRVVPDDIPIIVRERWGGISKTIDRYGEQALALLSLHSGIKIAEDGKTPVFTSDGVLGRSPRLSRETAAYIMGLNKRTMQRLLRDLIEHTDAIGPAEPGGPTEIRAGWKRRGHWLKKRPKMRKDGRPPKGTYYHVEIPALRLHRLLRPEEQLKTTRLGDGAPPAARTDADRGQMLRNAYTNDVYDKSIKIVHLTAEEWRQLQPTLKPPTKRDFQQSRRWWVESSLRLGYEANWIADRVGLNAQYVRQIRREMQLETRLNEQLDRIEHKLDLDLALRARLERNSHEAAISALAFRNGETPAEEWLRYLEERQTIS